MSLMQLPLILQFEQNFPVINPRRTGCLSLRALTTPSVFSSSEFIFGSILLLLGTMWSLGHPPSWDGPSARSKHPINTHWVSKRVVREERDSHSESFRDVPHVFARVLLINMLMETGLVVSFSLLEMYCGNSSEIRLSRQFLEIFVEQKWNLCLSLLPVVWM